MKQLFLPIALATSTLLTACMGSDSGSKKDSQVDAGLENNTKTQVVSTESHNIYVPSGMDDITIGDEYLNGHVFGAGSSLGDASSLLKESEETEEKKASIQAFAVSQETPKVISLGNRDLVSFAAARDASSMEKKAQDIIEKIEDVLSDFGTTSSIICIRRECCTTKDFINNIRRGCFSIRFKDLKFSLGFFLYRVVILKRTFRKRTFRKRTFRKKECLQPM